MHGSQPTTPAPKSIPLPVPRKSWTALDTLSANAVILSSRDRLLLAFANLQSYGIAAKACLDQTAETAHEDLWVELKATFPHGLGSYVFWLAGDEVLFSSSGDLMDGTELPLHYSTEDVVPGVIAACGDVDIEVVRRSHRVLGARDRSPRASLVLGQGSFR